MTRYVIFDSLSGDQLGAVDLFDDPPDEVIIKTLLDRGYLDAGSNEDNYTVDHAYMFSSENSLTILDDRQTPVVELDSEAALEEDDDAPADESDGDDTDDDDE